MFSGSAKSQPPVQCGGRTQHIHNLPSISTCRVHRQCPVRPSYASSSTPVQCGGAHSIFIIFRPYLRAVSTASSLSAPPVPRPQRHCNAGGAHGIFIIFRPYLRAVSTVNALSAPPVPRPHRHCSAGGAHGIFIIFRPYLRAVSTVNALSALLCLVLTATAVRGRTRHIHNLPSISTCRVHRQFPVRPFRASSSPPLQCGERTRHIHNLP